MKQIFTNCSAFLLCLLLTVDGGAQVSGAVFRDFNGNGSRQNTAGTYVEPGVQGIIINVYNSLDILIASYTSNATGGYSIPVSGTAYNGIPGSNTGFVPAGQPVRIEFVIPAAGACNVNAAIDFSSTNAAVYGTAVRFINGGAINIDYAINDPGQYVFDTAPFSNTYIFQSLLFNGDPLALPAGTSAPQRVFVKYPYNRHGLTALSAPEVLATNAQTGSTYGVAYSKQAKKIFVSAFLKRHAGFGPSNGTFNNAPGTIYIIDPSKNSSTGAAAYFTSLDALGYPTHNTSGTPAYGNGTSFTLSAPIPGSAVNSWYDRTEKITYIGNGQGVIGTNVTRGLGKDSSMASFDVAAFGQAGIVSLGDIEISDDGQFLFVSNLYDRKIYKLQLNSIQNPTSATVVNSWSLPNPPLRSASGITGAAVTYAGANDNTDFYTGLRGYQRPFGLKYYHGKLYAGAVTTGEGALGQTTTDNNDAIPEYTDLWSYVWELDPAVGFNASPVLQFPLNFNRGYDTDAIDETFNTWTNTMPATATTGNNFFGHPQPELAGIEFDVDGSMIVSFRDRMGDQAGTGNYMFIDTRTLRTVEAFGDILRAYKNPACNGWIIESNGDKDGPGTYVATASQKNGQGPSNYITGAGSGNGEFYFEDGIEKWDGTTTFDLHHLNTNQGSLALLPGSEEVTATTMDPTDYVTGGTTWFNNNTGINSRDYELYRGTGFNVNPGEPAKGNGMGDLELLTGLAPIEIGNRVWNDVDGDGIQDAGETGLAGVQLELLDALGSVIATCSTDANGNYFFLSGGTGTGQTGTGTVITSIQPATNYSVRIKGTVNINGTVSGNAGLGGSNHITLANHIGNGQAGWTDSDGQVAGGICKAAVFTGNWGETNHNIDFGFTPLILLPANGLLLTAGLNDNTVNLNWKTISEINAAYFEIERSTDNIIFSKTGITIPASGNSAAERKYSSTDNIFNLQHNGVIYYRIRLFDVDGKALYSNTAVVHAKNVAVECWPSPFKNQLSVSLFSDRKTSISIKLFDYTGKRVFEKIFEINKGNNQMNISGVDHLLPGIYLLQVKDAAGHKLLVKKLAKD